MLAILMAEKMNGTSGIINFNDRKGECRNTGWCIRKCPLYSGALVQSVHYVYSGTSDNGHSKQRTPLYIYKRNFLIHQPVYIYMYVYIQKRTTSLQWPE